MQTYTVSMCATNASSTPVTLTDARDGQTYTVRYINGNCWMTRNLAIGCNGSGATYGSNISSKQLAGTDSNISSTWSTPTNSLTQGDSVDEPRIACSSAYDAESNGAWWSATANGVEYRYFLSGNHFNVNYTNRPTGLYIRCIHN